MRQCINIYACASKYLLCDVGCRMSVLGGITALPPLQVAN